MKTFFDDQNIMLVGIVIGLMVLAWIVIMMGMLQMVDAQHMRNHIQTHYQPYIDKTSTHEKNIEKIFEILRKYKLTDETEKETEKLLF